MYMNFYLDEGSHGLIRQGFEWENIPPLAILTGPNGVGKTQLLQSLALTMGYSETDWRVYGLKGRVILEGEQQPAKAQFFRSEWPELQAGGNEDFESLRRYLVQFQDSRVNTTTAARYEAQWTRLEMETGKPRAEITSDDILRHPSLDIFILGDLSNLYSLARLFFAHYVLAALFQQQGASPEQCTERLGPAPWDVVNEILQTSELTFRVNKPEGELPNPFGNLRYTFELRDIRSEEIIPPYQLSSGERIIMNMALWRCAHSLGDRGPVTLLLDEPDAHLHPSFMRKFLDVIREDFIAKWGYRVIMTTHSPTTAALAPEGTLFEMTRDPVRVLPSTNRWQTVDRLTEGFVTVGPDTRYVFVEDQDDKDFYSRLYEELSIPQAGEEHCTLPQRRPNLVFIPIGATSSGNTGGRSKIEGMLSTFGPGVPIAGLADNDRQPETVPGVHLTSRCMLENYLYDPLCVYGYLAAREANPPVPGVPDRVNEREIRYLNVEQKQAIVDTMIDRLRAYRSGEAEEQQVDVEFLDRSVLRYPRWFLTARGKQELLPQPFAQSFPKEIRREELRTEYWKVRMIPLDLVHLLLRVQRAGSV